jgi:hypothetical protein
MGNKILKCILMKQDMRVQTWVHLAHYMALRQALVNGEMNLWDPKKAYLLSN